MGQLTTDVLRGLLGDHEPPCISLYQPTHRANPDNLQDPIRYKNLVRDIERSLREKYRGEVRPLLERFRSLADDYDFWTHQRDGLAIVASADTFEVFRLQRPVKELAVVADSFHLKPLLRMVQSADRYQVLCLDRHEATLFEGNRDALDEVDAGDMPTTITAALGEELTDPQRRIAYNAEPAVFHGQGGKKDEVDKDTERFFRVIDREVLDRFSRPSGLPLILAALPEYHAEFRRVSRNPFLEKDGRWHASRLPSGRGMQCLAADPRDPDVLYAGSRGEGVWKSTSRGRDWARLEFPEADVFSLAVSPADGAVYAGTEPSRLFVSRDEGRSWRELTGASGHPVPTDLELPAAPLDQPRAVDRPQPARRPADSWPGSSWAA